MAFVASGGLILITSVNTIFLIECLILFLIACVLKHFYQPTGRNLHRLNALSMFYLGFLEIIIKFQLEVL